MTQRITVTYHGESVRLDLSQTGGGLIAVPINALERLIAMLRDDGALVVHAPQQEATSDAP